MDIIDGIKTNFNKGYFGKSMLIEGLPDEYPAWTIKENGWYGVAVKMNNNAEFIEHFSTAIIQVANATIDNVSGYFLFLTCSDVELRDEFAVICSQFVATSEDGQERLKLISNPSQWWEKWKTLIGNAKSDQVVYPKIGELTLLESLLKKGENPKWTGIEGKTHDIELDDRSFEVKSTDTRYGYEIEISSIYQMKKAGETLDLVFYRFEPSHLGRSLDDLVESVVNLGFSRSALENELEKSGLERGCTARKKHYKLLETRIYPVDDDFPVLTIDSFVNSQLPSNITKVKYTIDLSGVKSKNEL